MIAKKEILFRLRTMITILFFMAGTHLQAQEQAAYVVSSGGGYSSGGEFTNFATTGGGVVKDHAIGGTFDKSIGFLYNNTIFMEIPEYNLFAESFPDSAGIVVGAGIYSEGDSIAVSATANEGYTFIGWGAPAGSFFDVNTASTFFFMPGEQVTMTAYFSEDSTTTSTFAINTGAFPDGAGSISGGGEYLNGTTVTVNANPAEGYRFISWTEDGVIVSTSQEYSFEVGDNRNLQANYALKQLTITLNSLPANNIGGSVQGGGIFTYGTEITISASENLGFTFDGWKEKGVVTETNSSYTFVVREDRELTGLFNGEQYNISASVAPDVSNGTVSGEGEYYYGDIVSLEATPEDGYYFIRWMDGDAQVSVRNPYLFSALEDRNLTAEFGVKWWTEKGSSKKKNDEWLITASTTPSEVGIVLGQGFHTDGSEVTLTASPNEGINFVKWMKDGIDLMDGNNDLVGADYTFTASADMDLVAVFDGETYSVQATADPVEAGNVNVSNEGSFFPGDLAILSAETNAGYMFRNWTLGSGGPQLSVADEYRFTVTEDRNIVANYEALPSYNLSITVVPEGAATVSGAGDYTVGTEASISVVPAEGYAFRYWSQENELLSRKSDTSLTVNENLAITAFLELSRYDIIYATDGNGSIDGSAEQTVSWGNDAATVTAVADSCFQFVAWSDGMTDNPRTDLSIKSNLSVTATFTEVIVDASVTMQGDSLTASIEGAAYQWVDCGNGNVVIDGATDRTFVPDSSGSYAVMIISGNCEVISSCFTITLSATGFSNTLADAFNFSVYPNPARNRFIIESDAEADFRVVNSLGQQVRRFELNSLNGYTVPVEGLNSGIYIIVGQLNDKVATKRVIITD